MANNDRSRVPDKQDVELCKAPDNFVSRIKTDLYVSKGTDNIYPIGLDPINGTNLTVSSDVDQDT